MLNVINRGDARTPLVRDGGARSACDLSSCFFLCIVFLYYSYPIHCRPYSLEIFLFFPHSLTLAEAPILCEDYSGFVDWIGLRTLSVLHWLSLCGHWVCTEWTSRSLVWTPCSKRDRFLHPVLSPCFTFWRPPLLNFDLHWAQWALSKWLFFLFPYLYLSLCPLCIFERERRSLKPYVHC